MEPGLAHVQEKKRVLPLIEVESRAIGSRKLNDATCEKWRYGYGEYNGQKVQVAQYCDDAGRPVAQKLRFRDKSFMVLGDLSQAGLFGQHLWRDGGKMVVVTEGEIDALSVSQLQDNKWPVVSVPNGAAGAKRAVEKSIEWLDKFDRVVFMLDMDGPGQAATVECAAAVTPGKGYIASLPLKDANDMLVAGRGREVIDAVWGAKLYRPDCLVSGDDVWRRLVESDDAASIMLPHSGLQTATHGVREGEVFTVVAGTGTGKSTFCRELAYEFCVNGNQRIGYVALEESVSRSAKGLLSIAVNRPLHLLGRDELDKDDVRAAFQRIKDRVVYYDHFGSLEDANLLSRLKYLFKGEGCSTIFLDHLSIIVSGMDEIKDERRTIDRLMTNLVSLAQQTRGRIVVVSHLSRRDGKPHEEGRATTLSDLRGSAGIGQLSHTIVAIERNQQDEENKHVSLARVLKCRHTGFTGQAGYLRYSPETGRLVEYATEFDAVEETGEFE